MIDHPTTRQNEEGNETALHDGGSRRRRVERFQDRPLSCTGSGSPYRLDASDSDDADTFFDVTYSNWICSSGHPAACKCQRFVPSRISIACLHRSCTSLVTGNYRPLEIVEGEGDVLSSSLKCLPSTMQPFSWLTALSCYMEGVFVPRFDMRQDIRVVLMRRARLQCKPPRGSSNTRLLVSSDLASVRFVHLPFPPTRHSRSLTASHFGSLRFIFPRFHLACLLRAKDDSPFDCQAQRKRSPLSSSLLRWQYWSSLCGCFPKSLNSPTPSVERFQFFPHNILLPHLFEHLTPLSLFNCL